MANKKKNRRGKGGGVTISFDADSRKEFITGFQKRKQERREFGQKKAAEEKLQERRDIKDAHKADVLANLKEAKRARKVTDKALDLMEAKATGTEIGPLPQGQERKAQADADDGASSEEEEDTTLKPKSMTEAIESSDEEGGQYTAFTQVNVDLDEWSLLREKAKPKKQKEVVVEKQRKIKKTNTGKKVKGQHMKIMQRSKKAKIRKAFAEG